MLNDKNDFRSYLLKSKLAFKRRYPFYFKTSSEPYQSANQQTESETKGYLFEQFIVSLFTPEYFTLLEWRSDKSFNGIYPVSCQFPDLEFYYKSNFESMHFAVECKWRRYFENGNLNWVKKTN